MLFPVFKPGEINAEQAEMLNRMTVEITRLIGLAVVPPLELYDFAGGKVIQLQPTPSTPLAATLCECSTVRAYMPLRTPFRARLTTNAGVTGYMPPVAFPPLPMYARLCVRATVRAYLPIRTPLWCRLAASSTVVGYMSFPIVAAADCSGHGGAELTGGGQTGLYTIVTNVSCVNGAIVMTTHEFAFLNGLLISIT